jgi:hypothetical protein
VPGLAIVEGYSALSGTRLAGATWERNRQGPAEDALPSMSDLIWIRRGKVELIDWSNEREGPG